MDLTHADVASETLAAVNSAAGIAYPETDAAATERRRLICAAAENGLLELVKARWPRPQEVTRRELSLAGGVAVAVTGMLPPEEEEPGMLWLRGRISGGSDVVERFRNDFLRLLTQFPFQGGEVVTAAGSRLQFGTLSAEKGGALEDGREDGIPVASGSAELTLRIDLAGSEFAEAEYSGEESASSGARAAWAALAPGYAWAALAQLLCERFGLRAEAVPGDPFREYCSLLLASAEPLTDPVLRRFRFRLETGSWRGPQLQEQLAELAGALPICDEVVTLPAGSSFRFRKIAGQELVCRPLRQWSRNRLEGSLELTVELDVANCSPVPDDLPEEPPSPERPAFDFGAMERALDELFLEKLAFDAEIPLAGSGQLLAGKPWGTRFLRFENDASGRLSTLFFQVEWSELERETALLRLGRLERLFPLYDCRIGDVTAAAVLMESNRTVPETIEHVEVTGGTFLLQVCVVY